MKRILASLLAICVAAGVLGVAGGSTLASFSDSETSAGNTFTAGTMFLISGGVEGNSSATLSLPTIGPQDRKSVV